MSGKLDKWGLPPAGAGVVRGKISNVRLSTREAAFGEMQIYDFELWTGEGEPPVAIRMEGNDFSHRVHDGWLAEIVDRTPSVRPIETRVLRLVLGPGEVGELRSFYPGRDDPSPKADRNWTLGAILLPVVFGLGMALLIFWYFGK